MSEISAQLAAALPLGPVGRPDWFNSLRNSGAEQFRAHGLPLRKDEAWKYTGLGLITQRETRLANVDDLAVQGSGAQPVVSVEHHLNIVNGRFLETSVTSVEGVTVLPLAQAVENAESR